MVSPIYAPIVRMALNWINFKPNGFSLEKTIAITLFCRGLWVVGYLGGFVVVLMQAEMHRYSYFAKQGYSDKESANAHA
ncbi:hypothetical protein CEXT_427041 [Caerostris extrusa]|uniref:Uncharacterized protein n=1 Tax=Caerostris extrusa TaxID=172846 RepID=A0AAV4XCC3_CAEEX|nr:hypothetical protein CEXT_427041 [Caerostris extrusa]